MANRRTATGHWARFVALGIRTFRPLGDRDDWKLLAEVPAICMETAVDARLSAKVGRLDSRRVIKEFEEGMVTRRAGISEHANRRDRLNVVALFDMRVAKKRGAVTKNALYSKYSTTPHERRQDVLWVLDEKRRHLQCGRATCC